MNETVTVRDAVKEDYAAIAELTYASYVEAGHIGVDDEYVHILTNVAARGDAPGRLVVATIPDADGQGEIVVGSCWFLTGGMPAAEVAVEGEFEFRMLAVHPEHQKHGVGTALVTEAIKRAQELGCTGVAITTMDSMLGAQHMYTKLGFQNVPERDWNFSLRGWADPYEGEPTFRAYVRAVESQSD